MRKFPLLVMGLLTAGVLLSGCHKDVPLVKTDTGESTSATTGTPDSGTPGDEVPGDSGATPSANADNPLASTTPTTNPAIDASGNMITKEEGKAPPAGRVWCDHCHGHLPKEDAVTIDGKTYCMACAEEIKK